MVLGANVMNPDNLIFDADMNSLIIFSVAFAS